MHNHVVNLQKKVHPPAPYYLKIKTIVARLQMELLQSLDHELLCDSEDAVTCEFESLQYSLLRQSFLLVVFRIAL